MRYLLIIIIAMLLASCSGNPEKTGYVELGPLYSDFNMKQELESQLTTVQNNRTAILDSLELHLNAMMNQLKSVPEPNQNDVTTFQLRQQEYHIKKEQFENETANLSGQYTEQIWQQINQYVEEFGKENGYTYIHGADGGGSVMYADESKNLTTQLTKYINNKYKGQN